MRVRRFKTDCVYIVNSIFIEVSALCLWLHLTLLCGSVLAAELLQIEILHPLLDAEADNEIDTETHCNLLLELLCGERHQLEALVQLWGHLEDDSKDDCVHDDHAIAKFLALPQILCEGPTIIVDEDDG